MTEQDKEIAIQTVKDILHVLHEACNANGAERPDY